MGWLSLCGGRRTPYAEPMSFPVFHCGYEGTYKVALRINGEEYQCILDTASPYLLISATTCQTCDKAQGLWRLDKGKQLNEHTQINFFSQHNEVEWYRDGLELADQKRKLPVKFGVIVENISHMVNGGSLPGRNVVGIAIAGKNLDACRHPSEQKTFITQLFGDNGFQNPVYSLVIDPDGQKGQFIVGKEAPGVKGWIPLVKADEMPVLQFSAEWILPIESAAIVDEDGNVLVPLPLRFARVDTGNTWLSMPASFGMLEWTVNAAGIVMNFRNGVQWFFPTQMWAGPVEVANKTGFGGLAHDKSLDTIPQNSEVCVIGNETLKGVTMVINLTTGMMGLGGNGIGLTKTGR